MAIPLESKTKTSETRVVMEKPTKKLHTRIVSLGAFILISITLVIFADLLGTTIAGSLGFTFAGLTEIETNSFILLVRIIGILAFIISIWFAALGEKVYLHKAGRYTQKALLAFICILVFMVVGMGYGLLLFFGSFLFTPKIVVRYHERILKLYRAIVGGVIVAVLFIELMFTTDILLNPFAAYLTPAGLGGVVLISAGFVIPLFLLMPRFIQSIWNLRPNIESFWNEFLHHKMGMAGLLIISAIVIVAVFAPLIAPYPWGEGSLQLEDLLAPPSAEHLLGTNHRGEDIFSRLIYGSQISLLVGFTASVVAVFIGTLVGLVSGYFGGIIDTILMRITDVFLCLPTLPLMLIFLVIFGQGLQNVIVVIAMLAWTGTARMVRSEALSLRERPLTEAAHALGGSDTYILFRHIMPNTFPLILANMILGVVNAILSEAGIAFLGFVDIHGQPSWGILLHWAWKNAALLSNRWWWFIPPGILILLTTLGFVFISHTADKVVNPRLRGRQG
ncbi:MAG: ABC transporter permease [Candidatus Thorarchaeota archaeon]